MPILGLSFSELKTVIGIVAVLLAVTFFVGVSVGFIAGRSTVSTQSPPTETITNDQGRQQRELGRLEKATQDIERRRRNLNSMAETPSEAMSEAEKRLRDKYGIHEPGPSPTSTSETPEQAVERKKKELRDKYRLPSPSPKTAGQ